MVSIFVDEDGITCYIHSAWANDADGYVDFSLEEYEGALYLGYYLDNDSSDVSDPSQYEWTLADPEDELYDDEADEDYYEEEEEEDDSITDDPVQMQLDALTGELENAKDDISRNESTNTEEIGLENELDGTNKGIEGYSLSDGLTAVTKAVVEDGIRSIDAIEVTKTSEAGKYLLFDCVNLRHKLAKRADGEEAEEDTTNVNTYTLSLTVSMSSEFTMPISIKNADGSGVMIEFDDLVIDSLLSDAELNNVFTFWESTAQNVFATESDQHLYFDLTAMPVNSSIILYNLKVEEGALATPYAITAKEVLEAAQSAEHAAQVAWDYADSAKTSAEAASASADQAKADAAAANRAATGALTQLSIIEDVAGTLDWITQHGSYVRTKDKTVDPNKVYFKMEEGDFVPIVGPAEDAEPAREKWYELDISSSQTEYIMAHLAVTSRGLWVLPSGLGNATDAQLAPNYKMLLSSDGVYLYDGSGNLVTKFGENVEFSSDRPQYIGGENAYIIYYDSDDDGKPDSIRIGGKNITLGDDTPLSEIINKSSNTLIYDHTYTIVDGVATFVAHVYSGGVEVTDEYDERCFQWSYRLSDKITGNPVITPLGYGKVKNFTVSNLKYGGNVIGTFTPPNAMRIEGILDSDGNLLYDSEGNQIVALSRFADSLA